MSEGDSMNGDTMTDPLRAALSDADKLRVLALWFDMWDRPETDRQAVLDDPRNPGRNEVQADLRRIADNLDAADTARPDAERREALADDRACDYCGSVDGLTPPWKPEDEPLTGAALLKTIEVVTDGLINPRLSEVDWDAVAALSGATEPLAEARPDVEALAEAIHILWPNDTWIDAESIAVEYARLTEARP